MKAIFAALVCLASLSAFAKNSDELVDNLRLNQSSITITKRLDKVKSVILPATRWSKKQTLKTVSYVKGKNCRLGRNLDLDAAAKVIPEGTEFRFTNSFEGNGLVKLMFKEGPRNYLIITCRENFLVKDTSIEELEKELQSAINLHR